MVDQSILEKAQHWLHEDFDLETREQVRFLVEKDPEELTDAFYRNLEFGTGGLRGIMGVGTNRMNKYTVGMATQGLANYLIKSFPDREISVAIAHDCRNNSRLFAAISANVLSANGIQVYLFDDLRPTPELSFAIRHFHCQSGIVITASHNPKEYNGYKVYWDDGGQLVPLTTKMSSGKWKRSILLPKCAFMAILTGSSGSDRKRMKPISIRSHHSRWQV